MNRMRDAAPRRSGSAFLFDFNFRRTDSAFNSIDENACAACELVSQIHIIVN
jgi:hypothetical protein